MNLQASVVFTLDELWLLHACIRHELPGQEQMKFPYYSRDLNDSLAEVILMCEEDGLRDAALVLSQGDCYVIDAVVRSDMKTPAGAPLGKAILTKTFKARRDLAGGPVATALEPAVPAIPDDLETQVKRYMRREERKRRSA